MEVGSITFHASGHEGSITLPDANFLNFKYVYCIQLFFCRDLWRVERVIILFCFNCKSRFYILVFTFCYFYYSYFYLSNFATVILDFSNIIYHSSFFLFLLQNFTIVALSILFFHFSFFILTFTIP